MVVGRRTRLIGKIICSAYWLSIFWFISIKSRVFAVMNISHLTSAVVLLRRSWQLRWSCGYSSGNVPCFNAECRNVKWSIFCVDAKAKCRNLLNFALTNSICDYLITTAPPHLGDILFSSLSSVYPTRIRQTFLNCADITLRHKNKYYKEV